MAIAQEARNYTFVGLITNALNLGVFSVFFDFLGLHIFYATALAYLIAITFSYFATRFIVFKQRSARGFLLTTLLYVGFVCFSALFQSTITTLLYQLSGHQYLSWAVGAVCAAILNFWGLRTFVFLDPDRHES